MDTWPNDAKQITRVVAGIQKVSTACSHIADRTLEEQFGFGNSQFKILWVLYHHEAGVAQKDIANWRNQTQAAISRQMHILKAQGLIEWRKDAEDKRAYVIALTAAGREFTERATKLLVKTYKPDFAVLSVKEMQHMGDSLEKIFERLCNYKQVNQGGNFGKD